MFYFRCRLKKRQPVKTNLTQGRAETHPIACSRKRSSFDCLSLCFIMIINLVNIKIKFKTAPNLVFRRPLAANQKKRMI
ncbi:hypothetical protein NEISICOT_00978 [Neisseria sicca ATCC 29256]|uniref:Uncharacterized protein n=1 Tax=Neisseria sicca ATCC 29256 TaxID=547045 RepID=C6M387_NEISI|nr:hypothetical protein NEISICOT_00978 [Neisseria sicca ATCC 29256]